MHILFYDFDFNLLYILPPFSKTIGYTSVNAKKEFIGPGSFEMVFVDNELKKIIEEKRDELLIQWGKFQGYLTGYQWKGNRFSVFGKHLNGLLSWRLIPPIKTLSDDEEPVSVGIKESMLEMFERLMEPYKDMFCEDMFAFCQTDKFTEVIRYKNEKREQGDKVIENFCKRFNIGYEIVADFNNGALYITFKKPEENSLILSENNLNAYDIVVSYDNKERVTRGYYYETYIQVDVEKTRIKYAENEDAVGLVGLRRRDGFLEAQTEHGAAKELSNNKVFNQYTFETKNIKYGEDYELGDIVRVQTGTETVKRKITAVSLWNEKEYGEKPVLSE